METRYPVHPSQGKTMDTNALRDAFLIENLFTPNSVRLIYSHFDRIIIGGICPTTAPLVLSGAKELASSSFFARREGGVINIGGAGKIVLDGKSYEIGPRDGLYIGMGTEEISYTSDDPHLPAKFYLLSGPAHKSYPNTLITQNEARQVKLGSLQESNKRTIYQYIHPEILQSCQLCMGLTVLDPNCIWNTMPVHTHERRMEVYLYFDMSPETIVFHFMGTPDETRHIIMRNEQAVISPSWSIHSGAGTNNYTFIWGMVGENQTFTDMDHVPMSDLK